MHRLWHGQVFSRKRGDGGDVGGDVQRVPDAYLFWLGEQQDWQLHMQQGLYGGGRRVVYVMQVLLHRKVTILVQIVMLLKRVL